MGRLIAGIIVGYIAIFIFVMVSFTVTYLALGTEGSFQSGSFDVSITWLILSFILGLAAAIVGGCVCQLIAKNPTGPKILAGFVLILGLLMAIPVLYQADDEASSIRSGDLGNFEAMQQAKQPAWFALLNPFVGAVGVMVGGRMKKSD